MTAFLSFCSSTFLTSWR